MSSVDFVCTQEQSKLVEQVREQTGSKEPQHVLLRFLVARNWDAAAASEQYTTDVRWRQEQNVGQYRRPVQGLHGSAMNSWLNSRPDSMLTVCGVELWPDLRQMVLGGQEGAWIYFGAPCMAFGHDRQGRPVHLQRAGIASGKRFADACTHFGKDWQKAFIARNIYFQELQAARMEEATQRFGRLVTQQVVIMDLAGMSFRPDPRSLTTFRDLAAIMSHHYPETLYKHFIINAPRVFTAIWRVIRSWLDPNTREKVPRALLSSRRDYLP